MCRLHSISWLHELITYLRTHHIHAFVINEMLWHKLKFPLILLPPPAPTIFYSFLLDFVETDEVNKWNMIMWLIKPHFKMCRISIHIFSIQPKLIPVSLIQYILNIFPKMPTETQSFNIVNQAKACIHIHRVNCWNWKMNKRNIIWVEQKDQ